MKSNNPWNNPKKNPKNNHNNQNNNQNNNMSGKTIIWFPDRLLWIIVIIPPGMME